MKKKESIKLDDIRTFLRGILPKPLKRFIRTIYYLPIDTIDLIMGRRDKFTPPRSKRSLIGPISDYKPSAALHLKYLIDFGGLKSNHKVLDVGCGYGRMAVALTKFLDSTGEYEGIDIVSDEIKWCRRKITTYYPNFQFILADLYNKSYNPKGKYRASEYKFPYENNHFDFVFLLAVFTNMVPTDIENYLSEITRVLKRNEVCFITFFLLNDESHDLIIKKQSDYNFKYFFKNYCLVDEKCPEYAIAYEEVFIKKLYDNYGLTIKEPIYYGGWAGRTNFLWHQDIIIAFKK